MPNAGKRGRYYDSVDKELKARMSGRMKKGKTERKICLETRYGFQGTVADGIRLWMMRVFFSNQGVLRLTS